MKQRLVNLRFRLTPEKAHALAVAPERGLQSRPWLAAQIVAAWLDDPKRKLPADGNRGELRAVPANKRDGVRRRIMILDGWKSARTQCGRGLRMISEVTEEYVFKLRSKGIRVSERTLYYWRYRFAVKGAVGLMDRRGIYREIQLGPRRAASGRR